MSQPDDKPTHLSETLDQDTWYGDSNGKWWKIAEMEPFFKAAAADRLLRLALPIAHAVFKDLYAYGYPSGEQAQWEVERGEAEAEHIMASEENAREWIARTPLYAALGGLPDLDATEEPEEAPVPPQRPDEQSRVELAELDKAIERTRETLRYLEELRGRLA